LALAPISGKSPKEPFFRQHCIFLKINSSLEQKIIVRVAHSGDASFANAITDEMASSAQARGTGIAKRSPEYVAKKINEGKSVIALTEDGTWVGFCYIEAWQHGQFVANSGLIVAPAFRKTGIAKKIKQTIFQLSREKYPTAKIFGLTTGLAVMKINSELGYEPVTYSELTDDEEFWAGCKSCVNYEILMSKDRKNCMCTAMLYEPKDPLAMEEVAADFSNNSKLYERFMKIKQSKLLNWFRKK
jgi:N-acetylglutamate synthase-like GNAT family acetyltransferase